MYHKISLLIFAIRLLVPVNYASATDNISYGLPSDLLTSDGIRKARIAPLIDFESLSGWKISTQNANAKLTISRECHLWGNYTGKLTFRRIRDGRSKIFLSPPKPVNINKPFNVVQCWIWRDVWSWVQHPRPAAQIKIKALFSTTSGKKFDIVLYFRPWKGWFLCYRKLTGTQKTLAAKGAKFTGFEIEGKMNETDNIAFFDNLAVMNVKSSGHLHFKPRPGRGIDMLPGEPLGMNTGDGKLPFPVSKKTILPTNLCKQFKNQIVVAKNVITADYSGRDIAISWKIDLKKGPFNGISVRVKDETEWIHPCKKGGMLLRTDTTDKYPRIQKLVSAEQKGNFVQTKWLMRQDGVESHAEVRYRIWGKSLVIEVIAPGGKIKAVTYGHAEGFDSPKLITLPYYTYKAQGTPAIVVSKNRQGKPLFFSGNTDWYISNASEICAKHFIKNNQVTYNFGTRYYPKNNGKYNGCFERFFLTLAPTLQEVLPSISNPTSPWKHIAGTKLWRTYGCSENRDKDYKFWTRIHRYGIREVIIVDHENMWTNLRHNPGSTTFVVNADPSKGGDKAQKRYGEFLQKKLGYFYGPYNEYADITALNKYWSPDHVSWMKNSQLLTTWDRCYGPKPAWILEAAEKILPVIQNKFHFRTAYCDVHTCWTPSERVDYDPRIPGAGTAALPFYSYGELFLLEKKIFNGPVYSEGGIHWQYCGLTDGNYAQDGYYEIQKNPWIVDFDLRKMHDLCCNFGMGYLDMFYTHGGGWAKDKAGWDKVYDRFLAATLAFGHPGFLGFRGGMIYTLRCYYMLQQLQTRYTLASARDIRYITADGKLSDTSQAIASGDYKRSQLAVRYDNGTVVVSNGNTKERLRAEVFSRHVDLPPNGYTGWSSDGKVYVCSSDENGHRYDYAVTPDYIFIDGRGKFIRKPKASCKGAGICRILTNGYEIIPFHSSNPGFAIDAVNAVALDYGQKVIGPAKLRKKNGLTYVEPVKGAFSYKLKNRKTNR